MISEEAGKLVNVQAHVVSRTKLFSLHDFDLDISSAGLGNMEGPGGVHNAFMLTYMAQKGQLQPTCRGVQVSDQGLLAPLSFSLSGGITLFPCTKFTIVLHSPNIVKNFFKGSVCKLVQR